MKSNSMKLNTNGIQIEFKFNLLKEQNHEEGESGYVKTTAAESTGDVHADAHVRVHMLEPGALAEWIRSDSCQPSL